MKLVRVMSDEFLTTFDVSANLYKKYQMTIHGDSPDECNQSSFYNFLVKSPLQVHFVSNRFVSDLVLFECYEKNSFKKRFVRY